MVPYDYFTKDEWHTVMSCILDTDGIKNSLGHVSSAQCISFTINMVYGIQESEYKGLCHNFSSYRETHSGYVARVDLLGDPCKLNNSLLLPCLLEMKLEDMPIYINAPDRRVSSLAIKRLEIGK